MKMSRESNMANVIHELCTNGSTIPEMMREAIPASDKIMLGKSFRK